MLLRQPWLKKLDPFRVFMTFSGLSGFAFALIFTASAIYQVETVGLNPLQLVLVGTLLETVAFFSEVPTGVLADTYSRRLSVLIGSVLIGVGFIIEGSIPLFAGVLLAQIFWGVGVTFHSGAADAWITDEIGEERAGQAFFQASQVGRLASIAGILASIALASLNIQFAIVAGGFMHILIGVYLLLFMPEDGFSPRPPEERETFGAMARTLREGAAMVKRRPVLLTILATTFIFGAFSEGFDRLSTAHMLNNIGLPTIGSFKPIVWFGAMDIVGMLIGTVVTEFIRRRIKTSSHTQVARALLWINAGIIGTIVAFAFAYNFLVGVLALWTIGNLRGLRYPLLTSWVNQGIDPSVRATVLSFTAQTDAFGQITGGPGVGFIGNRFGLRAALSLGGIILAPTLLLFTRTLRIGDSSVPVSEVAEPVV